MATTKLNKETKDPIYRRFVSDQVLTASQLNDVIDHFERQDRLTRICLNGVGIVCGLQINFNKNTFIEVSKGCAVTTDGDLISFEGGLYTQVKTFEDAMAKYPRFEGIQLLEIVTDKDAEEDNLKALNTVNDLENMVAVLYLEYFCKEETPCTSTDCDTQGEGQVARIRILLISKEDAKKIGNKDNDPLFDKHNNTKKFINLKVPEVKRVILQNNYVTNRQGIPVLSQNSNTANYVRLKSSYRKAIQNPPVLTQLKIGITKLFTDFETLLSTDTLGINATNINNKIDELLGFSVKDTPMDIQYRYDLLKDLVDTFNEIKCLIYDLRIACSPDINSFPKHLLLAELETAEDFLQCRHKFYPSPIIPFGKEKLEEIRALLLKIYHMLDEFIIPTSTSVPIKVTPSNDSNSVLSDRAIPYYYKTTGHLIKNWNYNKTKKYAESENNAYHTTNLSNLDSVQNPLDYNIDKHDFYRIEGHLGKDYRTALRDLDKIKVNKNLPFDIKVLSIDETLDTVDPEDFECEFEDLNAVLKAWRAEQDCLNAGVSKFFSGFSLKEKAKHKYYKLSSPITSFGFSGSDDTITTEETIRPHRSIRELLSPISTFDSVKPIDAGAIKAKIGGFLKFRNTYKIDTVILENLETDKDVLGHFVEKAMKEKPEGSAEDIVAIVKASIDQDPEIANLDKDEKMVAYTQPLEILAFTKAATHFMPDNVKEISPERINNYNATIKNLCSRVERSKKKMTKLLFNKESKYKRKGYEQQYALLLNQLSINCCTAAKMRVLLSEIQERKKKILEQKLLSKFVEKHTGLEHKAGVKQGGTFVMVYKGRSRSKKVIDPFRLIMEKQMIENSFNTNLTFVSANTGSVTADIKPTTIDALIDENVLPGDILDAILGTSVRPTTSNVTENTVVADFALPYICCSDCSPTQFIIPKTPMSLRLPVDFVCLDKDTKPIAFEVVPADGVVSADVENDFNGGVVQEDGKFFFDPLKISEELIGKEISFTVNKQFTDAKIIVFRKPLFNFLATEPRFSSDKKTAIVNFTVTGDNLPTGVTYLWDFGDKTLAGNSTDENPKHIYQLPLNEKNIVTVSLNITNGRCSETIEQELRFDVVNDETKCIDIVIPLIEAGLKELPKFIDIDSGLKKNVYDPTLELYTTTLDKMDSIIKGELNKELEIKFKKLILVTARHINIRKNEQDSFVFFALTNIFRLQIQLYYDLLRCQSTDQLLEFKTIINNVLKEIDKALQQFSKNKITMDKEGKLIKFLVALLKKFADSDFLINHIKIQLDLLNT